MDEAHKQALRARFGEALAWDEPLARYTVARLGGAARAVLRVGSVADLHAACLWAYQRGMPWRLLGGGANVLASDAGFDGLLIVNGARTVDINAQTGRVCADSGANLAPLARRAMALGVGGFEWAVSVPGTLGGAVVNNAGAHGGDMAGDLHSARILDLPAADVRDWSPAELEYDYRHSLLKATPGRYVVLRACLSLQPGQDSAALAARADEFIAHRKRTQPPGASLGSIFKNPPGDYAGRLIEAAGLKGQRLGGVQISPVHANFFVNLGGGTAADYAALIDLAQQAVYAQFGVWLEPEIERIGHWPD
ncbi:MAG: UDP-N-acetylmuramate dehydrogenase [Anaerolineales bacterium]